MPPDPVQDVEKSVLTQVIRASRCSIPRECLSWTQQIDKHPPHAGECGPLTETHSGQRDLLKEKPSRAKLSLHQPNSQSPGQSPTRQTLPQKDHAIVTSTRPLHLFIQTGLIRCDTNTAQRCSEHNCVLNACYIPAKRGGRQGVLKAQRCLK